MSEPPKKSIPSWQRSDIPPEPSQTPSQIGQEEKETSNEPQASEAAIASEDRSTLLEEAKKFLEDDAVRNAAPEHKVTFLKSKGVQSEEIQKLLQVNDSQGQEQQKVWSHPQPQQPLSLAKS